MSKIKIRRILDDLLYAHEIYCYWNEREYHNILGSLTKEELTEIKQEAANHLYSIRKQTEQLLLEGDNYEIPVYRY